MSPESVTASARVIWDKTRNPTKHVSDVLGVQRWQLRKAIHKIKTKSNLAPQDRVIIYSDGKVTDIHGAEIGNIHDEA